MNRIFFFIVSFLFIVHYCHCSSSGLGSSSSSSSSEVGDSEEVTQLKEQVLRFIDGLEAWAIDTTSGLTNEGEYFIEDCIFCSTSAGCAYSREEISTTFAAVSTLASGVKFENIKFTGINPSLAMKSATFTADELITLISTGCTFSLPRVYIIYFDTNEPDLVSQFHAADIDQDSVFALFAGVSPDAPSCN